MSFQLETPIKLSDLTLAKATAELREHRSRAFMKWLSCLAETRIPDAASRLFLARYPDAWGADQVKLSLATGETKSAVAPGSTSDSVWAGPLVGVTALAAGFAAIAHAQSLLGRLPDAQQVPFNVRIPTESAGGSFAWTGEGRPKPGTAMVFGTGVTLTLLKAAGIVSFSAEFLKLAAPGVDTALRNALTREIVAFQDGNMLDPAIAAVAGVRPASLLNGITPVTPGANFQASVQALIDAFFAARPGAMAPTFIAGAAKAAQLRAANPGFGLPIVSTDAAGPRVILLDAAALYYADGGTVIDVSREGSYQMNTTPDDPVSANTVLVSLWQSNAIGFRIERSLNFTALANSVQFLA